MNLYNLNLAPYAHKCAETLQQAFPSVVFTCGRRSMEDQARVMAVNLVQSGNPKWIAQTYLAGHLVQPVVDELPPGSTEAQYKKAILTRLASLDQEDLQKISAHLAGNAFDIAPMLDVNGLPSPEGYQVIDFVRRNLLSSKMLLKEGGLVRWHVQFDPDLTAEV